MKILLVALSLAAYASSARLDHLQYLPPHQNNAYKGTNSAQQPLSHPNGQGPFSSFGQELEPSFGQETPDKEPHQNQQYRVPQSNFEQEIGNTEPVTSQVHNGLNNQYSVPQKNKYQHEPEQPAVSFHSNTVLITSNQEQKHPSQFGPHTNPNFDSTSENPSLVRVPNPVGNSSFASSTPLANVQEPTFDTSPNQAFQNQPEYNNFGSDPLQNTEFAHPESLPHISDNAQNSVLNIPKENLLLSSEPEHTSFEDLNMHQANHPFKFKNAELTNNNFNNQFPNQFNANPTFNEQTSTSGPIPILRSVSNNNEDGTYQYAYETANDISAFEEGDARFDGTKAQGFYGYTSPEGKRIEVTYTADERGFLPQGDHIPTAPPIPEAILKSLEYIKRVEEERRLRGDVLDDGQYHEEYSESIDTAGRYNNNIHPNFVQEEQTPTLPFDQKRGNEFEGSPNNFQVRQDEATPGSGAPGISHNQFEGHNEPDGSREEFLSNAEGDNKSLSFLPFSDPTLGSSKREESKFGEQAGDIEGSVSNDAQHDVADMTFEGYKY